MRMWVTEIMSVSAHICVCEHTQTHVWVSAYFTHHGYSHWDDMAIMESENIYIEHTERLHDGLTLTSFHPVWGYFKLSSQGTAYMVNLYLQFLCNVIWYKVFFFSNTKNLILFVWFHIFRLNIFNCMVSSNYFILIAVCLPTGTRF